MNSQTDLWFFSYNQQLIVIRWRGNDTENKGSEHIV